MLYHLKLVAKVGLMTGALASLILLITLTLITDKAGDSYGYIIQSHALTRQYLGPAMVIAGLVLVSFSGLLTWIISLYSSFRVAGPLYRFSRNFKQAMISDSAELTGIRKGDCLQEQVQAIKQAVLALRDQRRAIRDATEEAVDALEAGDAARYMTAAARLKGLDEKYSL